VVWRYLGPQRRQLAFLAVVLVAVTVLSLAGPVMLQRFLDGLLAGRPWPSMAWLVVGFAVAGLAAQGLRAVEAALASGVAWEATNSLRRDLLSHAGNLPLAFHHEHAPGELVERIDGDSLLLGNFFSRFLITVVSQVLLVLGVVVAVSLVDWRLGMLLLILVLACTAALRTLARWGKGAWGAVRELQAAYFGRVEEELHAIEDTQGIGAQAHAVSRLERLGGRLWRADLRAFVAGSQLIWASTTVSVALATAVVLGGGAVLLGSESITLGVLYLLFAYVQQVHEPMIRLGNEVQDFQKARAGLARAQELLNLPREDAQDGQATLPGGPPGLALQDVSYSYDDSRRALDAVNVALRPGGTLALIGPSGGGKSTLVKLLARYLNPQVGQLRLGSVPVQDLRLADLRQAMAWVPQSTRLFAASARDNVTVFDDRISDAEVTAALHRVGLAEWLATLPDGLDTVIGDGGQGLSAGQTQLLGLARALIGDPSLVVLDEPVSRVDPITEAKIGAVLADLLRDRTAVVIAHRPETVRAADQVLVLDQGRVVESGPVDQLGSDPATYFARFNEGRS